MGLKISEIISALEEIKKSEGDLECYYASDEEGNSYYPVFYHASPMDIDDKKVCVINWWNLKNHI